MTLHRDSELLRSLFSIVALKNRPRPRLLQIFHAFSHVGSFLNRAHLPICFCCEGPFVHIVDSSVLSSASGCTFIAGQITCYPRSVELSVHKNGTQGWRAKLSSRVSLDLQGIYCYCHSSLSPNGICHLMDLMNLC